MDVYKLAVHVDLLALLLAFMILNLRAGGTNRNWASTVLRKSNVTRP